MSYSGVNAPFLILGASGQLGRDLVRSCVNRHIVCQSVQRARAPGWISIDLAVETDFRSLLNRTQPACVLNAAAYTGVDTAEAEPELARQVNTIAPGHLAEACRELGVPLVHFSTDYVFSGQQTLAYKEDDICAPLNVYGQSKVEGEQRIRDQAGCHYIFRSSWLYSPGRHNFVSTMLRLFAGENIVRVVDDQVGCPTWTYYLAESVIDFLHQGLSDPDQFNATGGTYHLCAQGQTSWYGFARAIADRMRSPPVRDPQATTSSAYTTPATRPALSVLDCHLAETRLGLRLPHWENQLDESMMIFNKLNGMPDLS